VTRHRYRLYLGNRPNAGRNTHERAVGKVVDYLFFVLPRLAFWYTVKFIATTLWQLTTLIATNVTRLVGHRQVKDTPAIASSPQVDVTEQFRAEKRQQRSSAMEDWDHQWGRLLDSRPDQPAEGAGVSPKKHEPVKEKSSAPKRIPSNTDHTAQAEPGELLTSDPRTMWAWAEYLEGRLSLPVSDEAARQVLAAIPPGDHVEIFGAVAIGAGLLGAKDTLPYEARFAARTFDRWILPSSGEEAEIIPASSTRHWGTARPVDVARWMEKSNYP
jgi:hypothetical protein